MNLENKISNPETSEVCGGGRKGNMTEVGQFLEKTKNVKLVRSAPNILHTDK